MLSCQRKCILDTLRVLESSMFIEKRPTKLNMRKIKAQ